jgi:hypothetical protein
MEEYYHKYSTMYTYASSHTYYANREVPNTNERQRQKGTSGDTSTTGERTDLPSQ